MRLIRAAIEGYRSIGAKVDIHVERDVTVFLGPNDHGKTNILNAIEHLNADKPFSTETDLNWDRATKPDEFPLITFQLQLDNCEHDLLVELVETASRAEPNTAPSTALPPSGPTTDAPIPPIMTVEIQGVGARRTYRVGEVPAPVVQQFAHDHLPRVEIIRPQQVIPDSASFKDIHSESHEFMRGILYYAGLDPNKAEELFAQNDTTMRQLREASTALNDTLKADWIQGKDLSYELSHDSATQQILLRIEDPAVGTRYVRASQRSSGFTHFFALKTILYARQQDHVVNKYVFLFDEPGIYLHPSGQRDLLAVLDAIGRHNQVLYSTHSLFMINRTFPARHRLIVKDRTGTRIDGKPFVGRWGPAIEVLGFSLAGTVLFAQYVLLAEGDADPVLLQAVFQKLVEWGKADADLNAFSVISTATSKNTDALIRILKEGSNAPSLLVLVDGDDGGKKRLKALESLLKAHEVDSFQLTDKTTVEDHLPAAGDTYIAAVGRYVTGLLHTLGQTEPTGETVTEGLLQAAKTKSVVGNKVNTGITWSLETAKELAGLDTTPSKVGVAREYVASLSSASAATFTDGQLKRSLALLRSVQTRLGIPELRDPDRKVTSD